MLIEKRVNVANTKLLFNTDFLIKLIFEGGDAIKGAMPTATMGDHIAFIEAVIYFGHDQYCKDCNQERPLRETIAASIMGLRLEETNKVYPAYLSFILRNMDSIDDAIHSYIRRSVDSEGIVELLKQAARLDRLAAELIM